MAGLLYAIISSAVVGLMLVTLHDYLYMIVIGTYGNIGTFFFEPVFVLNLCGKPRDMASMFVLFMWVLA